MSKLDSMIGKSMFSFQIGGTKFVQSLDDSKLVKWADRWNIAPDFSYAEFSLSDNIQRVIRVANPLEIQNLVSGSDVPSLVFNVLEIQPDLDKKCHFVVKLVLVGGEEIGYHISLQDPKPLIVPIPDNLSHIAFLIRLSGAGTLLPVTANVSIPSFVERSTLQSTKAMLAQVDKLGVGSEIDWTSFCSSGEHGKVLLAAFIAQSEAIKHQSYAVSKMSVRLWRQIHDLEESRADLDVTVQNWPDVKREIELTYANIVDGTRHAGRLSGIIQQIRNSIDDHGDDIRDFQYIRQRQNDEWRASIVTKSLELIQEGKIIAALANLWRQCEFPDFCLIVFELADKVGSSNPELCKTLISVATALDPNERRAQIGAAKLFKSGMITSAIEATSQIHSLADTDYLAELRLADKLRRDARSMLPRAGNPAKSATGIVYISSSTQPYVASGYTIRTHELVSAMRRAGQNVRCISRPGFPWDRPNVLPVGFEATSSTVGEIQYQHLRTPSVQDCFSTYIEMAAAALVNELKEDPPAIIHAASNYRNGLPALIAARQLGARFIYEVRGLWELTAASRNPGWEQSERFAYERSMEIMLIEESDLALTITAAVRDELGLQLTAENSIEILSNGVDPVKFKPMDRDMRLAERLGIHEDDLVLVYCGSVLEYEGLDDIIRAIAFLKNDGLEVKFVLVGDGNFLDDIKALAKKLGVESLIKFVGKVHPDKVNSYLSVADIVPIVRKNHKVCRLVSPLKPFEAMAMGKLVLASDLPALREIIIPGETGYLCDAQNPQMLASKLSDLSENRAQIGKVGETARSWVIDNHSWDAHAQKLGGYYEQVSAEFTQ